MNHISNIEVLKTNAKETGEKLANLRKVHPEQIKEQYELEREARKELTLVELEMLKQGIDA